MAKKIDPLIRKQYGAVTAMLTVADVKAAVSFYQKAFGFAKRGIMNGPDGRPIHAELTLRNTTLMLGPENPQRGARSAKTWRLASYFVSYGRKRRQTGSQGGSAWGHTSGAGDGHVLG